MGWPQPNIIHLIHLLTMEHTMRYGDTIVAWKWQKQRWWQGVWEIRWLQGASNSSELGIISHPFQSCRVQTAESLEVQIRTEEMPCTQTEPCRFFRFHIGHHRTFCRDVQRLLLDKGIDKLSTARVAIGSTRWRENTMTWHPMTWSEKTEKKRIEVPSL